jgi:hypothetical protein
MGCFRGATCCCGLPGVTHAPDVASCFGCQFSSLSETDAGNAPGDATGTTGERDSMTFSFISGAELVGSPIWAGNTGMTGNALPVFESPDEEIVGSALTVGWPTSCEPCSVEGDPSNGATGIGTNGEFGGEGTDVISVVPVLGEVCMAALSGFGGIGTGRVGSSAVGVLVVGVCGGAIGGAIVGTGMIAGATSAG